MGINFIADCETYVRMVLSEDDWEGDRPAKTALTLTDMSRGASGNRIEMLKPTSYGEVIGERSPVGFFKANAGEIRSIHDPNKPDNGFLLCPSKSGAHPESHADLCFKKNHPGEKPPKSWRSFRDKLFRICLSCTNSADLFPPQIEQKN